MKKILFVIILAIPMALSGELICLWKVGNLSRWVEKEYAKPEITNWIKIQLDHTSGKKEYIFTTNYTKISNIVYFYDFNSNKMSYFDFEKKRNSGWDIVIISQKNKTQE